MLAEAPFIGAPGLSMEYLCIAVDVGSNMGPRTSVNLRDTDKTSTDLDLALYTTLCMVNRKLIENPKHHVGIVAFGTEGTPRPSGSLGCTATVHPRRSMPALFLPLPSGPAASALTLAPLHAQAQTMTCTKRMTRTATVILWCVPVVPPPNAAGAAAC